MGRFANAARELRYARLVVTDPRNPAYWVQSLFGGRAIASSGVNVTAERAMAIATVYASCRNLGEDVGGLPLPVFEAAPGGRIRAYDHPAWRILNRVANPEMSAMALRETLTGHAALRGTGYANIEWAVAGARAVPAALWPLNPSRVRRVRNGRDGVEIAGLPDGQSAYWYTLPSGEVKVLLPDDVLAVHGFGPNGLEGYSILALAKESFGLAAAAEEFGGTFFGNGAVPGIVLKSPKALSDNAQKNLRASWNGEHQGLDNAQRIAILEEGISVEKIGIPPEDAQFLQTRQFQREEIASWFRMPPSKLQDLSHGTYSNVEQDDLSYVKWTLRAWGLRWDQQLALSRIVEPPFYAEHNLQGALAGDAASRGAFYQSLRAASGITSNQIADLENMPRSDTPGADDVWYPVNMLPSAAFDENGMTLAQRAHAAYELMRGGYEAKSVNKLLGLGNLAHTGTVPGKTTPDPAAGTP